MSASDIDICDLLRALHLERRQAQEPAVTRLSPEEDITMGPVVDLNCSSATAPVSFHPSSNVEPTGCAFLQALQHQLESYQTTNGEYLEAIFTHRGILFSFPNSHKMCGRGFADLADAVARRPWRADRDGDAEAVVAFRCEAQAISALLQPQV